MLKPTGKFPVGFLLQQLYSIIRHMSAFVPGLKLYFRKKEFIMLHYEISGDSNLTLVLLHGVMESTEVWYDMLPELEKYFRVIRIDLPGHGKSDVTAEVQTMELMAAEVKLH